MPRNGLSAAARRELARVGGVGGAAWLAKRLSRRFDRPITVREVRDTLKTAGVHKLGAGYYGLQDALVPQVYAFVAEQLDAHGPLPVQAVVDAILDAYPHGDPYAVYHWLLQEAGPFLVRAGTVLPRAMA